MPEPVGPGEVGYDPDRWFQHVVYVGLNIARQTGTGLPLFNGLRQRFSGIAADVLGAATTIIGQGVRAAAEWMAGGPDYTVDLDRLPLAPNGFFGGEETDRIVGLAEFRGLRTDTGETAYDNTRLNFPEDFSKADVNEIAEAFHEDDIKKSPDLIRLIEWHENVSMVWLGKRF